MTRQQFIDAMADAIAYAEGFYVTGSRAYRNNNPGNITLDITGTAVGNDGMFMVYRTALDGWDALKYQIALIVDDTSGIYNSDMTIREIAQRYTTTQQFEWASNVASRLGVSLDVPISSLITGATVAGGAGVLILLIAAFVYYKRV